MRLATDELTRRAHPQAAVGVVLVVVLDPSWELGEHGEGIRAGLDAGVVALEGLHERLADAVALRATHRVKQATKLRARAKSRVSRAV